MNPFDSFKPRALSFELNNVWAMAHAAEAAYMSAAEISGLGDKWGFDEVRFFDAQGTQAYVMAQPDLILLSFRGTEPDKIEDVATDLRIRKIGGPLAGRVHRGFLMALLHVWDDHNLPGGGKHKGIEHVVNDLRKQVGGSPAVWITGHSLGAALATLATAFMVEEGRPVHGLYTFGSPRVGDHEFASALEGRQKRIYRLVNNNDVVTRVPPRSFGYEHVGDFWYLSEKGDLKDDPNSWYLFLDRGLGVLCDIGEIGIDGIKDHSMRDDEDGYLPALAKALS